MKYFVNVHKIYFEKSVKMYIDKKWIIYYTIDSDGIGFISHSS